jgi:hypothetical protein
VKDKTHILKCTKDYVLIKQKKYVENTKEILSNGLYFSKLTRWY